MRVQHPLFSKEIHTEKKRSRTIIFHGGGGGSPSSLPLIPLIIALLFLNSLRIMRVQHPLFSKEIKYL